MRNDFCSGYLMHSAKGTSWKKKGAKYISRIWKNGRWVYQYKITGKGYLKDAQEASEKRNLYSKLSAQKAKDYKNKQKAVKDTEKRISIYKENNPNKNNAKQGYNDTLMYYRNEQNFNKNPNKATATAYVNSAVNKARNQDRAERNVKYYENTMTNETNKLRKQKEQAQSAGISYASTKNLEKVYRDTEAKNKSLYDESLAGKIESGKKTISKLIDSLKPQTTITTSSNLYPTGTKKVVKK